MNMRTYNQKIDELVAKINIHDIELPVFNIDETSIDHGNDLKNTVINQLINLNMQKITKLKDGIELWEAGDRLCGHLFAPPDFEKSKLYRTKLSQQITAVESQNNALEQVLNTFEQEKAQFTDELSKLLAENAKLTSELKSACSSQKESSKEMSEEIEELKNANQSLKDELNQTESSLNSALEQLQEAQAELQELRNQQDGGQYSPRFKW